MIVYLKDSQWKRKSWDLAVGADEWDVKSQEFWCVDSKKIDLLWQDGSTTHCKGKRQHSQRSTVSVCRFLFPGRFINSMPARCFDLISSCLGLWLPGEELKPSVFTQTLQPKVYLPFPRYSLLMPAYTVQRQINQNRREWVQRNRSHEPSYEYKDSHLLKWQKAHLFQTSLIEKQHKDW